MIAGHAIGLAVRYVAGSAPQRTRALDIENRKMRSHVRQLEALGYTVTLTQAAWPTPPLHPAPLALRRVLLPAQLR